MGLIEHSVPEPQTLAEAAETIKVGCEWLAGRIGAVEAERDIAQQQLRGAVSMLEWLASLDDDEDGRRAVTLQAIIDRAKATIGGQ